MKYWTLEEHIMYATGVLIATAYEWLNYGLIAILFELTLN